MGTGRFRFLLEGKELIYFQFCSLIVILQFLGNHMEVLVFVFVFITFLLSDSHFTTLCQFPV